MSPSLGPLPPAQFISSLALSPGPFALDIRLLLEDTVHTAATSHAHTQVQG